jgi:nucleotidyltransferase/DNA polymerase involved in DNA repair
MAEEDDRNTTQQMSPPATDNSLRNMSAEESKHELEEAIRGSNEVLMSSNTVLSLFPDSVVVDRAKVSIVKRNFFRMANVMSMRIEDVLNATCTVGPVLGTVSVTSRVINEDQTSTIGRFWRADAVRLKRIIQGYVIALQRNIDCSALETEELSQMLEKLGADEHTNT